MKTRAKSATSVMLVGALFCGAGCTLFTTQAVGTFIGEKAAKAAVKKVKEDHEEKKRAREEGRSDDRSDDERTGHRDAGKVD